MKNGRMLNLALCVVIFACLLTLTGCGRAAAKAEGTMEDIRQILNKSEQMVAVADIHVDYGDRVFDFKIKYKGDSSGGEIEILEPETLKGITAKISESGAKIIFEGAELNTGPIGDGLSPAGVIPMLINEWKTGFVDFVSKEKLDSRSAVAMSSELPDGSKQKTWFDEKSSLPIRGEITSQERVVLVIVFENVAYE